MKTGTDEQKRVTDQIDSQTVLEFEEAVMQTAMGVVFVVAALIGVWGILSLFGGIIQAGGVIELCRGWLAAVSGM